MRRRVQEALIESRLMFHNAPCRFADPNESTNLGFLPNSWGAWLGFELRSPCVTLPQVCTPVCLRNRQPPD
jgi:hypothetical protein